ncbi:MAG: sporulation protein YtfJ [Clostridiales bacterium]|nr:sporulation protein YtfJ [Clostridiales bacterium]
MDHPIGQLMQTTLENIKDMVDVNTVVGEPIEAGNGSTIIPISKVSFGFLAGGGEYDAAHQAALEHTPFAGGSGAGVSVQPVGFLVVGEDGVKMLPAQHLTAWERAMNCAPQLMEDIRSLLGCREEKNGQEGIMP